MRRTATKPGTNAMVRHLNPPSFRLRDIAEAGPHGPNALLLIPLKLRDDAHALSSFPPPLASILLASKPKKPGHPIWGRSQKAKENITRFRQC